MTEETESRVIKLLQDMRLRMDSMAMDVGDIKTRLSNLEEAEGRSNIALAGVNRRLDRVDERIGRIERRLDLADA